VTTSTADTTETADTETPDQPVQAVPRDGRWGIIQLMGHKAIAGRVTPDELLGGGTMLVQTPSSDGVTLRKEQSFQPSGSALYLANWRTREETLNWLYPPVQLALTRTLLDDADDEDLYDEDPDDEDDEAPL
jgi:hypothetical protein